MAPGEGLDEALRREVAEEAGLDVRLESVAGHSGFDLPRVRVVVLYFNCARCAGEVRLSPGHSDHLWASAEQLREMELTEPFARFVHSAGVVRGPA
jgi:ADP-ribose pyrophosphatase YjhB (NUDIX family)